MVEVLVASALMGVSLVVLLGAMSTLLIGSQTAERRIIEERIVRNALEAAMASRSCSPPSAASPMVVGGVPYKVTVTVVCENAVLAEYTATATSPSNEKLSLTADRLLVPGAGQPGAQ